MQCGKVLKEQGYLPGAEVQLLSLHPPGSKWLSNIIQHGGYLRALLFRDKKFQKIPLKNIAQDLIEYI